MLRTPVARLSGTHDGDFPSTRDPAAVTAAYLARALCDPQGLRAVRRDRAGVAFRSPGIGGLRFLRRPEVRRARSRDRNPVSCWRKNHPACGGHVDCDRSAWRSGANLILWSADRKSTRLNSSHLVISYAVFCLKKKKDHNSI